jgi:signal transduction histidine kinase
MTPHVRLTNETSARVGWVVGIFSEAMLLATLALMFIDRSVPLPPSASGWNVPDVLKVVYNLAVPVIAIVLVSRRPENILGWLFLVASFTLSLSAFGTAYAAHALLASPGSLPGGNAMMWLANVVGPIAFLLLLYLLLLFPTGLVPTPRWRWVAWSGGLISAVIVIGNAISATQAWADPFNPNAATNSSTVQTIVSFSLLVPFAASASAPFVRFFRSGGEERLQMKWFASAAVLVFVTEFFPGANNNGAAPANLVSVIQNTSILLLMIAIGVAILKYRLYEIDVVISKAVIYGTIAVFITAVYVGLVVGVGTLVGDRGNAFLSAVAAAIVALAFQPVRQWARRLANRVVYGKRATPYEVLSGFAERMADTLSIEDVLPRTARTVAEGTGANRADVWLRVGRALHVAGSWPTQREGSVVDLPSADQIRVPAASLVVPVIHQGELLGAISMQKGLGDPVTPPEEKLLKDVASQAGLVLRNVALIQDLRASRQRLVAAQDEERRRLERNIHDGAQQQLVALAVKANLAGSLVGKDAGKERELIDQLKSDVQDALDNLRDLARGIYPPLLADKGLAVALESQARKSPLPVEVSSDGIGRYPQEVEAAVYFCTLEGLQNVAKYADAKSATVRLAQSDGHLRFEVGDDGRGFDPASTGYGTGLQGIADRLAALGGTLEVTSAPGEGTLVSGSLPAVSTS